MSAEPDPQALLYAHDIARLNAVRHLYERLVPTSLGSGGTLPEPQVREASVMFADIRGFTGVAEKYQQEPAKLLAILNEYLVVMVRAILRSGGIVEKFLGDAVLATFGAWEYDPDHASRALAASIGVIGAANGLNRARAGELGVSWEVGVGLCSGWVAVGPLGPPDRFELAVLGDPVNIASRLVNQAGGSEMLVANSTYQRVAANVAAELIGERAVKGRVGRLGVYRINLGRPT